MDLEPKLLASEASKPRRPNNTPLLWVCQDSSGSVQCESVGGARLMPLAPGLYLSQNAMSHMPLSVLFHRSAMLSCQVWPWRAS